MKIRIEDIIKYLAPEKEKVIVKEDEFIEFFFKNNFIDNKKNTEKEKQEFKEKAKSEFVFEEKSEFKETNSIRKINNNQYLKKIQNSINYFSFVKDYFEDLLKQRQDFTNNIPNKKLIVEPKSILGGVLGWTILGWDLMGKRDDMEYSHMNRYVEVHEGIHTDDEYETRVISDWILSYDSEWKNY